VIEEGLTFDEDRQALVKKLTLALAYALETVLSGGAIILLCIA
jgi:hypothetical protein